MSIKFQVCFVLANFHAAMVHARHFRAMLNAFDQVSQPRSFRFSFRFNGLACVACVPQRVSTFATLPSWSVSIFYFRGHDKCRRSLAVPFLRPLADSVTKPELCLYSSTYMDYIVDRLLVKTSSLAGLWPVIVTRGGGGPCKFTEYNPVCSS